MSTKSTVTILSLLVAIGFIAYQLRSEKQNANGLLSKDPPSEDQPDDEPHARTVQESTASRTATQNPLVPPRTRSEERNRESVAETLLAQPASVSGFVLDEHGYPFPNATVTLDVGADTNVIAPHKSFETRTTASPPPRPAFTRARIAQEVITA